MQGRNPANAKGIDVSHWQGAIDWAKVKAAGFSFAFLKATEGSKYTDDTVSANVKGARSNGIAVGVYHFLRASNVTEAANEANFFCSTINDIGYVLDLPPVLDIETTEGGNKENITAVCQTWLTIVEKKLGVRPIIYTYRSFIDSYLGSSLSAYKLWLAAYDAEELPDRGGWTQWEFLQHTDKGVVPGISGNVDLNEYKGSVSELTVKQIYKDVPPAHWAAASISSVSEYKLMNGYEDGTFKPDQPITRAEMAKVLNDILYIMNKKGLL